MMNFAEALTSGRLRIIDWEMELRGWQPVYNHPLRRPPRKLGEESYRPEPKSDPY